jgi:hypothetical protein
VHLSFPLFILQISFVSLKLHGPCAYTTSFPPFQR